MCRSDIQEKKRLNYHLYEALCKSVYKPSAFFKGILLPLASSGDCTLREATIFASVLARVSQLSGIASDDREPVSADISCYRRSARCASGGLR